MNARVRELLEGAIQSDGIEELFETGKHISVDIFSDEYLDKINAIQLPNTKIKVLQRLLSQAIDEYKKVNRIMGMEFSDRLKRVVDEYNNRRRDEAFANEVLDDVAEQLAKLLEELKKEKDSFKGMGIDYEEKAFYDILKAVAKKYEFEYPDDKMIELSKRIKIIVDEGNLIFIVDKPEFLIGKSKEADGTIANSTKVSRNHCRIVRENGSYMIQDLESTNGTSVNGYTLEPDQKYYLKDGDSLVLADVEFKITVS